MASTKTIIASIAGLGLAAGVIVLVSVPRKDKPASVAKAKPPVIIVCPVLPTAPLPPPQMQEPAPEPVAPKMVIQEPVIETPEPPAPATPPSAPSPVGLDLSDGPGDFVVGSLNGSGDGNGKGSPDSGIPSTGSRFGRYAVMIQNTLAAEIRRNSALKNAAFNTKVAIWVDGTGRISRVQLSDSIGNSRTDDAIRTNLTGLQLQDTLPAEMPMPIHIRLSGLKTL